MDELTAIVTRAKTGDSAAFDELVVRFQNRAVAYAYSLMGCRAAAEDVAQEAFFHAWREIGTLREPGAFAAWLKRIVVRYSDRHRRGQKATVALQESAVAASLASPENTAAIAEKKAMVQTIHDLLATLQSEDRQILSLYYLSGSDLSEISEFMEITTEAAKKRLQRARMRLKERTLSLMQEELGQLAPSKDTRFVEIARLQRRIVEALEADPTVGAAYLSPFGDDEGFGAANDAWASLNVHVVCEETEMDALAAGRLAFASRIACPALYVDTPQNAPLHGYYLMTIYDAPAGPYEVDWYWHTKPATDIPANARILFNRAEVPVSSEKQVWGLLDEAQWTDALKKVRSARTEEEKEAEEMRNTTHFFWAMWLIAAKYAARHPDDLAVGFAPMLLGVLKDAARKSGVVYVEPLLPEQAPTLAEKVVVLQKLSDAMTALNADKPEVIHRFLALIQSR